MHQGNYLTNAVTSSAAERITMLSASQEQEWVECTVFGILRWAGVDLYIYCYWPLDKTTIIEPTWLPCYFNFSGLFSGVALPFSSSLLRVFAFTRQAAAAVQQV